MKTIMKRALLPTVLLSFSSLAFAGSQTYTIDFEQYPEFTQITNQYAAEQVSFTNALQLVAPDYDYFDYPPSSGSGVITNDPNDPLEVLFTPGAVNISGYYSAPDGLVVTAYDGLGNVLATFAGAGTNMANAPFTITSATTGISWIAISATDGADSETVDDLTYTTTPEPGTFLLLGSGALGLAGLLRRKLVR